jgi:uncharacterized protein (DUF433 family)
LISGKEAGGMEAASALLWTLLELISSSDKLRKIRDKETPNMALTIQTDPIPLRVDEHGVIRVGDSQVLLDIVIREFNNGAEPEAIAQGYPTLHLADVYGVIAYYLRHRKEIDDYVQGRREEAEKLRQEIEAKQPNRAELRAKLLARKAQIEHASPGKR